MLFVIRWKSMWYSMLRTLSQHSKNLLNSLTDNVDFPNNGMIPIFEGNVRDCSNTYIFTQSSWARELTFTINETEEK